MRWWTILAGVLALFLAQPPHAAAQTCFRVCLKTKLDSDGLTDDDIRNRMDSCRDACERRTKAGLGGNVVSCAQHKLNRADLDKIRSASAAPLSYAGAFTWDVTNVLKHRVIRRVDLITQNMELQDVVMTLAGTVPPGATQTLLFDSSPGGIPSLGVTTRIKAIYACALRHRRGQDENK